MPRDDYAHRQQVRKDRLESSAKRAREDADSRFKKADNMASVIPMGQPILVGHHSESSDRRYRERIHQNMSKGIESDERAHELERKAERIGRGGVSADDPEAPLKLKKKLADCESSQERMKAANRALRRGDDNALNDLGFSDQQIADLKTPDFCGRSGFPDYALKNNNAEMRRLRKRIEELGEPSEAMPDLEGCGFVVTENTDENRIQFIFDDKPPSETRALLKRHRFRWAPSQGAWQRMLNDAGRLSARLVVEELS